MSCRVLGSARPRPAPPVGGLYTNLGDGPALPFPATYGFAITLALMVAAIVAGAVLYRRQDDSGPELARTG
jgi:hypothetical protein